MSVNILMTKSEVEASFKTDSKWMGLDTEGAATRGWGLTYSLDKGIGYCIQVKHKEALEAFKRCLAQFIAYGGKLIIHNALWDLDVLLAMGIRLPEGCYLDSMVMSYNIGREPQGLKPLSYRHLDVKMRSYEDVVGL